MKILKHNWKEGFASVGIETPDDLWALKSIILPGDSLRGSTERKLKVGSGEMGSVVRKRMTLQIEVEKIEYAADGSSLRALGIITDGPDDVPRGDHHSFTLEQGEHVTIGKGSWPRHMIDKLERATKLDSAILVVLFDREEAKLFSVTRRGVHEVAQLKGDVAKKANDEKKASNFFKEIVEELTAQDARGIYAHIVAGAPAFWREYVERELPPALKGKTIMTTISAVEKTAIRELLARPEVAKLLKESGTLREMALVEQALEALAKGKLAYGDKDVEEAVFQANCAVLLVSEGAIAKARQEGPERSAQLETLLAAADAARADVHILASDEAMGKIDGLGGTVALKRW